MAWGVDMWLDMGTCGMVLGHVAWVGGMYEVVGSCTRV